MTINFISFLDQKVTNTLSVVFAQRNRVKQIQDHLKNLESLCSVLGFCFRETVTKIHPSLVESEGSRSICNETLNKLASSVEQWHETKIQRMQEVS